MTNTPVGIENVIVPDRYETLARRANDKLPSIVVPVPESLAVVDDIFGRMRRTGRGAFLILRGASGAGKSTFLHTVNLYKTGVRTLSVPGGSSIRSFLESHKPSTEMLEILVLEEREAAISFTDSELEDWLHSINGFIRSPKGEKCLVAWPCNTDALRDRIVSLANSIGGEALLGPKLPWLNFSGPAKESFLTIAERTLSVLNQSATLSDLGLTAEQVNTAAESANTIGGFLAALDSQIADSQLEVSKLLDREQCRLWIIVAAGNDPGPDVAGLTRGRFAAIDTERLMTSTGANVVADLKKQPEKIGILGTVLDAKILHLPVLAASAIARAYADEPLKRRMREVGLSLKPDSKEDAKSRLLQTEMASVFASGTQGTLNRGPKLGSKSVETFEKLAEIASTNDSYLNRTIGSALEDAGLILSFETEKVFGDKLKRKTDILAQSTEGPVRIEVMWRKSTGRANIADYTLTKVANYGRAIGFLD